MNQRQQLCLLVSVAVVAGMVIYPPWDLACRDGTDHIRGRSAWIWQPPQMEWYYSSHPLEPHISLSRLAVRLAVTVAVCALLIAALADRKSKTHIIPASRKPPLSCC